MYFPGFIYNVPFLVFTYMKMKYNMQLIHSEIRDINSAWRLSSALSEARFAGLLIFSFCSEKKKSKAKC